MTGGFAPPATGQAMVAASLPCMFTAMDVSSQASDGHLLVTLHAPGWMRHILISPAPC